MMPIVCRLRGARCLSQGHPAATAEQAFRPDAVTLGHPLFHAHCRGSPIPSEAMRSELSTPSASRRWAGEILKGQAGRMAIQLVGKMLGTH